MAQTLETLSRRTASMRGIRGVVHTMKTLSVINSTPYEHAAHAIEHYHQTVLDGLHAFFKSRGQQEAMPSENLKHVMVVFGSDHGLCGNYNEALATFVAKQCQGPPDEPLKVLCVGARVADALVDHNIDVASTLFPAASVDGIGRLANLLAQRLEVIQRAAHPNGLAVSLAYWTRDKGNGQQPVLTPLLPLDTGLVSNLKSKPWQSRSLPSYSMQGSDLFEALLHNHLFASLFRAIAEALLTENSARLALMQQAEQSVDDRLDQLMSDTRAVRQDEITTELLDVIIGFEALREIKVPKRGDANEIAETENPS